MERGISRLDRIRPAKHPKTKKRIAGSSKFFMSPPNLRVIIEILIYKVKSILISLYIGENWWMLLLDNENCFWYSLRLATWNACERGLWEVLLMFHQQSKVHA